MLPSAGNNGGITLINGTPATPTSDPFQNAGALFQILPYLEQNAVYKSGNASQIQSRDYLDLLLPFPSQADDASHGGRHQQLALNDYAQPMWKNEALGGLNRAAGTCGATRRAT